MTRNQNKKPLVEALNRYVEDGIIPFHTPGHKQGRSMDSGFSRLMGSGLLNRDLTEVEGLDNLHQPEGVIKEVQDLFAALGGAAEAWITVGGKVAAYYAALSSVLAPGDSFLMDRHIGAAGWHAAVLGDFRPIILPSQSFAGGGIFLCPQPEQISEALQENSEAKALLVSGMTETGIVCDLGPIRAICQEKGCALLVDDTHNSAALVYNKPIPSALSAGADLVIYSDFRLPGAPAQGAVIFRKTARPSSLRIRTALQTIQSTSPSYLIMAAMDELRYQLWRCGAPILNDQRQILDYIKAKYRDNPERPGMLIEDLLDSNYRVDPSRITVCYHSPIRSLSAHSEWRYGHDYMVFIPDMGSARINPEQVLTELLAISSEDAGRREHIAMDLELYSDSLDLGWHALKINVPLEKAAAGKLARPICLPGTDGGWLFPGETISSDMVSILMLDSDFLKNGIEIYREV